MSLEFVAIGLVAGSILTAGWKSVTGCTGGHHFDACGPPEDTRYETVPFTSGNKHMIVRKDRYVCNHQGCNAEQIVKSNVKRAHIDNIKEAIDEIEAMGE